VAVIFYGSTVWTNYQPTLSVNSVEVKNQNTGQKYASIKSVTAKLDLFSIFCFWPKFEKAIYQLLQSRERQELFLHGFLVKKI